MENVIQFRFEGMGNYNSSGTEGVSGTYFILDCEIQGVRVRTPVFGLDSGVFLSPESALKLALLALEHPMYLKEDDPRLPLLEKLQSARVVGKKRRRIRVPK